MLWSPLPRATVRVNWSESWYRPPSAKSSGWASWYQVLLAHLIRPERWSPSLAGLLSRRSFSSLAAAPGFAQIRTAPPSRYARTDLGVEQVRPELLRHRDQSPVRIEPPVHRHARAAAQG